MITLSLLFLLGAAVVCGLQTLWFCSNLPIHVFKVLRIVGEEDEVFTWEEWQIWITTRNAFFGELLTCSVCSSFWLSLSVSSVQHYALGIGNDFWYVVSATLVWPAICYALYKLTGNE